MNLPEPEDRLNSWKEIAVFLGRTIRTVQRWEKNDGLPLRRGGPGQRGAVIGSKREISEWWERRQSSGQEDEAEENARHPSIGRYRRAVLVIALTVAVAAAVLVWRRDGSIGAGPPPIGRLLVTSTSEGRTFLSIPLNATASALALSPSGRLAFVSIPDERAVKVVDLRSRQIVDRFEVIDDPASLTLSSDGGRLFVAGSSELGVFDLRRRTLTRFNPGGRVQDVHLSPDGRHVWVTMAQAGLKILDVEQAQWETVPTIGCPMHLTPAPRSRRLFLSYQCGGPGGRSGHDAIEIIDERERMPIISRAGPPLVGTPLAVSPDGQHLWVDAGDACANPEYDMEGCPAGSGAVLHAFRASTLDPVLTVRVAGGRNDSVPIFFPDGTRLVLGGFPLTVINRALGTVYESSDRKAGFGVFTDDGTRFVALDFEQENRAILDLEVAPPLDAALPRGISSYWSGDGTANDIVGGTHAVDTAGLRFEPGRYGRAFSFGHASTGVSYGRRLDADIAGGPAAYVAWIKPRRTGVPLHIASRTSSHTWTWSITNQGRLAFCPVQAKPDGSCAVGGLIGSVTLRPDLWYHVGVVRSDSALTLFVDGKEDASGPLTSGFQPPNPLEGTPVLRLGAGPDGSGPFDGLIDEVMLYRRALSGEDLARIMRATSLDQR